MVRKDFRFIQNTLIIKSQGWICGGLKRLTGLFQGKDEADEFLCGMRYSNVVMLCLSSGKEPISTNIISWQSVVHKISNLFKMIRGGTYR